jgi:signal transduction histidine kinase
MTQGKRPVGPKRDGKREEFYQRRLKGMYPPPENLPASISIRQAEELQSRVKELEARLAGQAPEAVENSADSVTVPVVPSPVRSSSKTSVPTQPPHQVDVVAAWREKWLNIILRAGVVIGLLAVVVTLVNDVATRDWRDAVITSLAYSILVATAFVRMPYRMRASALLVLVFALYLNSLTSSGLRGDARAYLFVVILFAVLLLGVRAGIIAMAASILAMLVVAWGVVSGQFALTTLLDQMNTSVWVSTGVVAVMLTLIMAVAIVSLEREFTAAQARERLALDAVIRERAHMAERVEERTHDLELAAQIGRTLTEKLDDLAGMLKSAVEIIRGQFGLYYTQVYLTDPSGKQLALRAGTGNVGEELLKRGHHLAINSGSLNGRAAADRKAVIVANTALSKTFLPNPLLPKTRSEMAIPLVVGTRVIGVLDMQSEIPDALNEDNLPALEALAGQLAVAIQNAGLFAEAQEARRDLEAQARPETVSGWQDFLDGVNRPDRVGYTYDQHATARIYDFGMGASSACASIPITITGASVGSIQVVQENRVLTKHEQEVLEATAARLGQHLDGLRLLAQAERYRAEAQQAVRQLTSRGWESYLSTRKSSVPGFVFDQNEVRPLTATMDGTSGGALKQPLLVRDQKIGELEVELKDHDTGADEILSAVAGQLSSHIENLRLSEQNEKRAYEMETVAEMSTTTSTVLDPDRLIQTIVDLTKQRFGVYHAHIYLANDSWKTLMLAAGAGDVGSQMVAEEHSIPFDAEKSLVARCARERRAVIVNDVRSDPAFLPNPLLPATRAEMAVPMIVGDQLLGVFDVQSDKVGGFADEDAGIYTTLASQVAVALQNARLYVEQAATVTQLRELDRLKSSFLANMSHELRTPLNSILGFADVILEELDGPLTENMGTDLHLIQKNGQHLLHLINDVLDMAKIEAGRMNLSPEQFVVQDVLEEVVSITSTLADEKKLDVRVDEDSDPDVALLADRTRLQQVMINLVNNAIKFTDKGWISIHAKRQGEGAALIAVRDTGMGIPPDKLDAIFQEFAQIDTSSTRKVGGTGLGLPISRRLVEMHGGRLWAESNGIPGEGSTFYVELPLEAQLTEPVEKMVK